jgi:hypothetical protein
MHAKAHVNSVARHWMESASRPGLHSRRRGCARKRMMPDVGERPRRLRAGLTRARAFATQRRCGDTPIRNEFTKGELLADNHATGLFPQFEGREAHKAHGQQGRRKIAIRRVPTSGTQHFAGWLLRLVQRTRPTFYSGAFGGASPPGEPRQRVATHNRMGNRNFTSMKRAVYIHDHVSGRSKWKWHK